jgi:hypothetical protein
MVARQRLLLPLKPPPGQVQGARPHITRRGQQPEAPPPLRCRDPQAHPGRPVHDRRTFARMRAGHPVSAPAGYDISGTPPIRSARAAPAAGQTSSDAALAGDDGVNDGRHAFSVSDQNPHEPVPDGEYARWPEPVKQSADE